MLRRNSKECRFFCSSIELLHREHLFLAIWDSFTLCHMWHHYLFIRLHSVAKAPSKKATICIGHPLPVQEEGYSSPERDGHESSRQGANNS